MIIKALAAAGLLLGSTSALAGEIKGPPPTANVPSPPGTSISNGNSRCSFSGLNDTPQGAGAPGSPEYDPGGQVQSYGYFMAQFGLFDPSDPLFREIFAFPAQGCNPTRTGGRH
ncbi:hypothetical protein [Sphingomonas flavescens]|jgi:hypothetical protein|uniref:hypothetical protein n=1 Tax=Sphingomonas flavescens TaxID=3132797 RepID=UPI002804DF77|nr:hypothetical protein [Sphingomonas limnosediminicola]